MPAGLPDIILPEICDPCAEIERAEEEAAAQAERIERARQAWIRCVGDYANTDEKFPTFPRGALHSARGWVKNASKPFFGIVGPSGRGKSRVAALALKSPFWRGRHPKWIDSFRLQWAIAKQWDDNHRREADRIIDEAMYADFVVIDDLGAMKSTEATGDVVRSILEHRGNRRLPLLWTSNEPVAEMFLGLNEFQRGRIVSRLEGNSEIVSA